MSSEVIHREKLSVGAVTRRAIFNRTRLIQLGVLIVVVIVWQVLGLQLGAFILAPPSSLVPATVDLISSGELGRALLNSLGTLVAGFAIAAVVGVVVGVLMGWYRPFARVINPFVSAGYVLPEAALVPIFIIWFGLGYESRIVTVFMFSVFEILLSTYAGVRSVDPVLINASRSFGASRAQLFRYVAVPASLPFIFTGLRMGVARAVKGMVVAELLFAVTGLGGLIENAANNYQTDRVFVVVIVVALMGIILSAIVEWIERIVAPWSVTDG
jgi:ABC-type nitrate/sulfonate/bicarbonate transport system permease component